MPGQIKGKWVRSPYNTTFRLNYDDKKGLGYGVLEPTGFNAPRQQRGNFPYLDPDFYADSDAEAGTALGDMTPEEMDVFVNKINQGYLPSDFGAGAGIDRFYFVAGNTPMHEVAENTSLTRHGGKHGPMLRTGTAYPYPGGGGTSYKRTGTMSGYSHSPPPLAVEPELGQFNIYDIRNMPDPGERTLMKLRVLIRDILRHQQNAQTLDI